VKPRQRRIIFNNGMIASSDDVMDEWQRESPRSMRAQRQK
jgi:hypothetical protein